MTKTTCDVLIVGAGGAGLAAAIEARAQGADVILIEKNDAPGGTTAWSIGSFTATQTPQQLAAEHGDEAPGVRQWGLRRGRSPACKGVRGRAPDRLSTPIRRAALAACSCGRAMVTAPSERTEPQFPALSRKTMTPALNVT